MLDTEQTLCGYLTRLCDMEAEWNGLPGAEASWADVG